MEALARDVKANNTMNNMNNIFLNVEQWLKSILLTLPFSICRSLTEQTKSKHKTLLYNTWWNNTNKITSFVRSDWVFQYLHIST